MGGEEKLSREALSLLKTLCFMQHLAGKENLASGQTCPTPVSHSSLFHPSTAPNMNQFASAANGGWCRVRAL